GVMVFQEDVVNVAHAFAGLDWATADGLRKALSKKRPGPALASYFEIFVRGAEARGRDTASIAAVWENILSFAGYSFCKGHSCSYIQVAQQSCYLRANHPAEFIAAVLSNGGGFYRPFAYVAEAMRMGVTVLPPDVNTSEWRCTGREKELRVGFQFIKGLTAEGAEELVAERDRSGPYASLAELRARTALRPDDLRLLVKVGACDRIADGMNRPQMLWAVDVSPALGRETTERRGLRSGDDGTVRDHVVFTSETPPPSPSLRSGSGAGWSAGGGALPALPDYPPLRKREDAWALLGFCTDAHPMTLHADQLKRFRLVRSTEMQQHVGKRVLMAGMYTTGKPVH